MLRRTFLVSLAGAVAGAQTATTVDRDGMLTAEGKRRFVIGLYDLPKVPDAWREAKTAGINLVHVAPNAEAFGHAHDHGLRTWVSLGSISAKSRAADEARIRGVVEQFRKDPALLFWETEDEPAYVWKSRSARISPEQIIATHDFVRALDPERPLYLNHAPVNLESTLQRYNPGAEIAAADVYPVIPRGIREMYALWEDGQQGDLLNQTISQVGQYTDKMRRVAGPGRAVFMVLQAFAWEDLRQKDHDPKMVLYPDREQLRSMAYQAIVHGANGLLFWGLASMPEGAPIWNDLRTVTKELAGLAPELAARPVKLPLRIEYRDIGHSVDRGIEWTARPSRNGIVLLCVNADRYPVEAVLHLPQAKTMDVALAPFEARTIRV